MLTIYVSLRDQQINTVDGHMMTVKATFVRQADGFVSLQDWKPQPDVSDIEVVILRRFFSKKIQLSPDTKVAMLRFMREYHAKQDISFDCYAFTNMVKGVETHKLHDMLKYWELRVLPWLMRPGSTIFLLSGEDRFHHAAVYIGSRLYLSVWGAGGDLEVATLTAMKRDYGAERVMLAIPKSS